MSVFSKQDYELINLGVCIKNQADRLDVEHEGVPLEGVVVRIAEAAVAARREAIRLLTAESRVGVVAEEPEWEYGATNVDDDRPVSVRDTLAEGREAQEFYTRERGRPTRLMTRTKAIPAGPWVPVKQEA